MSGNAFKEYDVKPSTYQHYLNVNSVLKTWFPKVKAAGSTQFFEQNFDWAKSQERADLDFVVQASKDVIKIRIENNPYIVKHKVFGNTVSTLWKTSDGFIHVDLMPSNHVENESWIMTGGSKSFKGVTRNVLLCFLARKKSEHDSIVTGRDIKWTIAFPGGIGLKENGAKPNGRVTSPDHILDMLGLPHDEKSIKASKTFEGLCSIIEINDNFIDDFQEYASSQWLYKKSPGVFDVAFEYMRSEHSLV